MNNSDKKPVDVEITDDTVTVTLDNQKLKVTEEQVTSAGKQVFKTIGLTIGLVAVGAIGGAILGAVLAPTAGWAILAGIGGFLGGGAIGAKTGGFLMTRTDAYKGLKKVAEIEGKKPGTFAKVMNAIDHKIKSSKKLAAGTAQGAFKQANDDTPKADVTQDNTPVIPKAAPKSPNN